MNSKVDKIVGTFVKAVQKLESESVRLLNAANAAEDQAERLEQEALILNAEAGRAGRIASKLNELVV
jgi:hypothetical protein